MRQYWTFVFQGVPFSDHIFTDKALFNSFMIVDAKVIFTEHFVTTDNGNIPLSDHYGLAVDIEIE